MERHEIPVAALVMEVAAEAERIGGRLMKAVENAERKRR